MLTLYRIGMAVLLTGVIAFTATLELNRSATIAEVTDIQQKLEREADFIEATKAAQEYSAPLIALSEQLASENSMFTEVLDRARAAVAAKDLELIQTKEALNESVEMLSEQIDDNNNCVDRIRELEEFVAQLLAKIPEDDRPLLPDDRFDPAYNTPETN
jgi:hypothetical protein